MPLFQGLRVVYKFGVVSLSLQYQQGRAKRGLMAFCACVDSVINYSSFRLVFWISGRYVSRKISSQGKADHRCARPVHHWICEQRTPAQKHYLLEVPSHLIVFNDGPSRSPRIAKVAKRQCGETLARQTSGHHLLMWGQ